MSISRYLFWIGLTGVSFLIQAQENTLYSGSTTLQKRALLYQNLTRNIKRDLAYSIKTDHEEKWMDAFASLELLQFKSAFVDKRISDAFDSLQFESDDFKRSLIQLGYASYEGQFKKPVWDLLNITNDANVFAYAAEYYIEHDSSKIISTIQLLDKKFGVILESNVTLHQLAIHLSSIMQKEQLGNKMGFSVLIRKDFIEGQTVLYSFQRKNRDFAGLAIIRKGDGTFVKDSTGSILNVPQLARSISGMPFYLQYGNTPQGIYKMNGFGVSMSSFIGPTPNVQLQMPGEVNKQIFFSDSTITDSVWQLADYQKLLPEKLKNYHPLFESYYAGTAGRSEIICHGTTINPDYYYGKPYFPHTPSEGCLTTIEAWNGKRLSSNQQILINGLLQAGGAHGYCLVIDLDDIKHEVELSDILPLLKEAEKQ